MGLNSTADCPDTARPIAISLPSSAGRRSQTRWTIMAPTTSSPNW